MKIKEMNPAGTYEERFNYHRVSHGRYTATIENFITITNLKTKHEFQKIEHVCIPFSRYFKSSRKSRELFSISD
jgi:hypothetical protein